ncbi:MAG: class I SAM-dependent methyltransferase [Candidatus Aureabacteria bacterium]|nr:class I SAM-dependent methyltransferase [Candidatus Auribacterota bacterium]
MLLIAKDWTDYELIDAGEGERLERWGKYIFVRPDPQVIWPRVKNSKLWEAPHAKYFRSSRGGGRWEKYRDFPERWQISYKNLSFTIRPTDFKHMGLFPEQAVNWSWIERCIQTSPAPPKILNLFAYTGGATAAAASAGAEICHVDSAKGMVSWAKDNLRLSGLSERPVRFIVDDVFKFVKRENRRKRKYDAIIMDPPSYGRGKSGETWKIEKYLLALIEECMHILSKNPLFFLINSYTAGYSPLVLKNVLLSTVVSVYQGRVSEGEIALPVSGTSYVLPCGVFGRWEREKVKNQK